jgi:O-antigen/teichoic acid export membrane protein
MSVTNPSLLDRPARERLLGRVDATGDDLPDRRRDRHRRIGIASVFGIGSRALTALALLIAVPVASAHLTDAELGLWTLLVTGVALLGFLDLGLGNGLLTSLSSAIGADDRAAARRLVSSSLAGMAALSLGLGAAAVVMVPRVDWAGALGAPATEVQGVTAAVLAFVLLVLASVPLGIGQRIHLAYQQGWAASAATGIGSALSIAFVLVAGRLDAGLPWFVAAMAGGPVVAYLGETGWVLTRSHDDLRPALADVHLATVGALLRTGALFCVLALAGAAAYQSDALIVAHRLGAHEVTRFGVVGRLFLLTPTILAAVLLPLWPAYAEATARGDLRWVRTTLRRSLATCFVVAAVASTVLLLVARPLLEAWAPEIGSPSFGLLVAFGAWALVSACSTALGVYLNGVGRLGLQVLMALAMVAANVPASWFLAERIGPAGPVWASVVTQLVFVVAPLALVLRGSLRRVQP